jgi:outer membrane protein TolC
MKRRAALANIAPLLCIVVLAGCANYTPRPLDDGAIDEVLASPDRDALAGQALQLKHPRLPPIKVDFTKPLSAEAIAVIAVIANPDLRALRMQQRVADAQVFASGLLPDPQISLGRDSVLSPSDAGLISAVAGSLTLDLLGALATRHAEREIARRAAQKTRLDIAWQEWLTAGQARLLSVRLPYLRAASALAQEAAIAGEDILARTLQAAGRGDLKGDEVEARRIGAADARARALGLQRDLGATVMALNQLLGLKPDEPLALAKPPAAADWIAPDPATLFASARGARLDLQALASGYASHQAMLRRAVLGQYPRLSLTLNRARDTSNVQTAGPAVSLDLPLWNRNRGAIAAASATREQLRSEYQARLHQTRADIAALVAALNRDEQARSALSAQLPAVEDIAAKIIAAAKRGDLPLATADSARSAATDKRLALLALEQSCAEQRIALALAVGLPFPEATQKP